MGAPSIQIDYWRTWQNGERMTHFAAEGDDRAFCGSDLVGDAMVHDHPPKLLSRSKQHRVTCRFCLRELDVAKAFLSQTKKLKQQRRNNDRN